MNRPFLHPRLALVILLALCSQSSWSQGTIRGFVKDKESGEAILFVAVGLADTPYSARTDENGYYSLSKVPAGTYVLIVQSQDHDKFEETVTLGDGDVLTRNLLLVPLTTELGPVEITSSGSEQRTQVRVSVETIRPEDIKKIPSFGGQADIVQVLTTLPGFISTGDQGGQIYIRGGSPVQNKVLLDGMIIYNAFHSIGLFSVFDSDVISNADVYSGGFSAEYGGRISSVMDITSRDGNKSHFKGKISANPIGSKLVLEGPIQKLTGRGSGISYILSAKTSYLEQTSKTVYSYINDGNGLPFNYTDLYGKLSFGGSGAKFNAFGFRFSDDVNNYQSLAHLGWQNGGGGMNFLVTPGSSPVLISGNFAASKYKILLQEESVEDRFSSIGSYNLGLDFKYILKQDELKYGIEVVGFTTDFLTFNSLGVKIRQEESTSELNGFFTYKLSRGKWLAEPGLRIQYYSSLSTKFSPEPRLGVKFKASRRLRFKAATGIYTQNLMAANSDRDVVNLFYGFLAGPENLQKEFVNPAGNVRDVKSALQRAIHYVAGFEYDLTEHWNMNVEGYYRDFRQVTNLNRNKIFPDDQFNQDRPDVLRKDFIIESGRAMGVDIVMKYEEKNNYLWVVYSLGNVDRWDGFRWYDPVFDRRHNINIVGNHSWGKNQSWEFSIRWNLGSGLPFTQTQGYYQPPSVSNGIATDYIVANSSELGIQYASLNEGQLPYYHRLDMNLRKTVEMSKRVKLECNAGITNVYSRANVFYIDRVTGKRVDQLPFLPAVGFDLSF